MSWLLVRNLVRFTALPYMLVLCLPLLVWAEEENVPRLRFFFYDGDQIDWVVSADKEAFAAHLKDDAGSQQLVNSLRDAVHDEAEVP